MDEEKLAIHTEMGRVRKHLAEIESKMTPSEIADAKAKLKDKYARARAQKPADNNKSP